MPGIEPTYESRHDQGRCISKCSLKCNGMDENRKPSLWPVHDYCAYVQQSIKLIQRILTHFARESITEQLTFLLALLMLN